MKQFILDRLYLLACWSGRRNLRWQRWLHARGARRYREIRGQER
jgi:hypothetical protein